jgi:signal peptidase I
MNVPVMQDSSSSDTPRGSSGSSRSFFTYTVIALGLALFIRFFIAAPYVVSGASMEPTFDNWHYLIIDRLSYEITEPKRGDVIVFDLPQDTSRSLIKRIIGVPGDTVVLKGQSVAIINAEHPEGFTLSEPYLDPANLGGSNEMTITLGADQFFVLGDNRRVSADSRLWGVLPRNDIVGRVILRLFPFPAVSILPGEARYEENSPQS